MRNDEWAIVYPGTAYEFGTPATPVFNITTPDLGDVEIRGADGDRPRSDGRAFGVDYRGGRTVSFDLGIRGSETDIHAHYARLATAWRADPVRQTPGAVAELRARYRDQERVTFGRPRRFAGNLSGAKNGLGLVTADFVTADDRWYSVEEHSASVALVPAPGGGLVAPLGSPLATTESSDRSIGIDVTSDLPAWPIIEISGPVVDPEIEVVGLWKIVLRASLAYDETVVIDTAPWARTILRNGASVGGILTRTSARLSKATLPPGSHEVVLRGTSDTGTAVAQLRWRDSFSSL